MTSSVDIVAEGLARLGLEPPEGAEEKLERYMRLLERWNNVFNLTAISGERNVAALHILDSAALVPVLKCLAPKARTVLDVGSGGGLPAVPLAVLVPELTVTAVDAVGKKAAFINQVSIELGLNNLSARHARVESLRGRFSYDVVTSRAFATLKDFVEITRGLTAPGGVWLAMKGVYPQCEIDELPDWVSVLETTPCAVPGLNAERHVVRMIEREAHHG